MCRARFLPASKINSCVINRATLADGCIVTDAKINHSTLGVRSVVRDQSLLENVVMMGADNFETIEDLEENSFVDIINLENLDLSHNRLTDLRRGAVHR